MLALLLMPLLLAACWVGGVWYDVAESMSVVPPGNYRLVEPGASPLEGEVLPIARNADGSLAIKGDSPWRVITIPFGPEADQRYIIQAQQMDRPYPRALFMLMDVRGGRIFITIPPCGGAVKEAVEQSGGSVSRDPSSASSCTFPGKQIFEAQLGAFIARNGSSKPDMELVRVTD